MTKLNRAKPIPISKEEYVALAEDIQKIEDTPEPPTTDSELHKQLMDIAKNNSICINRQLSATEYQAEVWPLANKAVDQIIHLVARSNQLAALEGQLKELEYTSRRQPLADYYYSRRRQQLQQALDTLKKES